jgi:hypothetical protein
MVASAIQKLKRMPAMAKKTIKTVSTVLMDTPCFSGGAESRTRARNGSGVGKVTGPQAEGREQVTQDNKKTHRGGGNAKMGDQNAVPDAGDQNVTHGGTNLKTAQA